MFSLNGVPLDGTDWWVEARTRKFTDMTQEVGELAEQNRDGGLTLPGRAASVTWPVYMTCRLGKVEELTALFRSAGQVTLTADPSRFAGVVYLGRTTVSEHPFAGIGVFAFALRVAVPFWRDSTLLTSSPVALNSASVVVQGLFPGLSAPVQDFIVRVKGSVTGLTVTDSGGSWFSYTPTVPSGSYLRVDAVSGRGFIFTSDVWTGTNTEVSGLVDFGGPRDVFEMTPYWTDVANRSGRLTVATTARSGATVEVRGRGAFVV